MQMSMTSQNTMSQYALQTQEIKTKKKITTKQKTKDSTVKEILELGWQNQKRQSERAN